MNLATGNSYYMYSFDFLTARSLKNSLVLSTLSFCTAYLDCPFKVTILVLQEYCGCTAYLECPFKVAILCCRNTVVAQRILTVPLKLLSLCCRNTVVAQRILTVPLKLLSLCSRNTVDSADQQEIWGGSQLWPGKTSSAIHSDIC